MYGYLASMQIQPGHRDEVAAILIGGAGALREAGCLLYVVGAPATDENTVTVYEVWQSRQHHDESLQRPETKAAIAQAMPMLAGGFSNQELLVLGGLGV